MDILKEICDKKRAYVEHLKAQTPQSELEQKVQDIEPPRGFINALRMKKEKNEPAIIAEIKRASPSAGNIRPDLSVAEIAKMYEDNGAACLSVLTDTPYFKGKDEDLITARQSCALPALRKDFMIDPYQIYESKSLGADCILIIMAALTHEVAKDMLDLSRALSLDALIEVHNEKELLDALEMQPDLLGVNNRDLKRQVTDIGISMTLHEKIPNGILSVSESGINSPEVLGKLFSTGYDSFLIGEHFLRQPEPHKTVQNFCKNNG